MTSAEQNRLDVTTMNLVHDVIDVPDEIMPAHWTCCKPSFGHYESTHAPWSREIVRQYIECAIREISNDDSLFWKPFSLTGLLLTNDYEVKKN